MLGLFRYFKRPRSIYSFSAEELRQQHREEAGKKGVGRNESVHGKFSGEYVGDFVYGAIDGTVTTFAVVAGVAGADLSASIVLVLGLANLFADGFAMAIGNFLSIRSEKQRYELVKLEEEYEIEKVPEYEREEIRKIYQAKGLEGNVLDKTVGVITSDKDRWLREMLFEEHGLTPDFKSPFTGGLVTYLAFILIGFIPLLSFAAVIFIPNLEAYTFVISVALTAVALFTIGALKTLVVRGSVFRAGFETLGMGGLAAIVAYIVGYILRGLA